jgi:hypothetical protein
MALVRFLEIQLTFFQDSSEVRTRMVAPPPEHHSETVHPSHPQANVRG